MNIRSYENLNRLFATEGLAGSGKAGSGKAYSLLQTLTKSEEDALNALIQKNCSVESIDPTIVGEGVATKHLNITMDKKFHDLTKKILGPTGRSLAQFLPGATQKLVSELQAKKNILLQKQAAAQDLNTRTAYAFEADQCQNALEQIVFGTLTTAAEVKKHNLRRFGNLFSTETMQTYAAATVFYPVFENTLVWFNAAGTTYTKLIPIKQVMNEVTQPVVHTMTYVLQKYDENNKVIAEVERSELYRSFDDPKYAAFRQYMDREITFVKAEFKKMIDLKGTNLTKGGKPALLPLENIKPDFTIVSHKIADEEELQGPIDIKTPYTITASPAVNESYYNGQNFFYTPNPADPEKFYIVSISYDSIKYNLLINIEKAQGAESLPDIEEVTFRFKLHDVNFVQRNDTRWQIYERPAFLETPTAKRHEINHNMNEFQVMSMRNDADNLTRLMGLHTEQVGNDKEAMFYRGVDGLNQKLAAEKKAAKMTSTEGQVLYLESILDLATKSDLNRLEGLGIRLGSEVGAFVRNYNSIAKTQMNTSLSMLCHSTSIGIIAQDTKAIAGEVNADSNGGFLGVDVETRTQVITMGTDSAAPVSAIIVGTDKEDLKANKYDSRGDLKAKGDIEYEFLIFPRFQEANLATNLMIETPSRVISDPNFRSETNKNIAATFIEYAAQFASIRNAGGKLTIKGAMITGVM